MLDPRAATTNTTIQRTNIGYQLQCSNLPKIYLCQPQYPRAPPTRLCLKYRRKTPPTSNKVPISFFSTCSNSMGLKGRLWVEVQGQYHLLLRVSRSAFQSIDFYNRKRGIISPSWCLSERDIAQVSLWNLDNLIVEIFSEFVNFLHGLSCFLSRIEHCCRSNTQ